VKAAALYLTRTEISSRFRSNVLPLHGSNRETSEPSQRIQAILVASARHQANDMHPVDVGHASSGARHGPADAAPHPPSGSWRFSAANGGVEEQAVA
jgi:hypothetical protein